ncbi:BLUF domain-containing protein [Spirosoma pollinicola]|uniref:BLUF domain protein n=1 Tax=Spirosoma pollinicola TaxID=2057025 RepID=A0A2K8YY68_9BACT|nr:BLUF domain-containing protein [Spirosoma pollinicola]AUD02573.1 BLUF domain protein [Spirosoma pollinicola]
MEYCIVYLSSSKGLFSEEQLARILQQSRQKNQAVGITGILLYFNGCIIQVLEGEEEHVKNLYNVIRQDAQHTQVISLYSYPIEKRTFSDWSMGYKTISSSEFNHIKDQLPFINNPASSILQEDNVILSLVKQFYLNNRGN